MMMFKSNIGDWCQWTSVFIFVFLYSAALSRREFQVWSFKVEFGWKVWRILPNQEFFIGLKVSLRGIVHVVAYGKAIGIRRFWLGRVHLSHKETPWAKCLPSTKNIGVANIKDSILCATLLCTANIGITTLYWCDDDIGIWMKDRIRCGASFSHFYHFEIG